MTTTLAPSVKLNTPTVSDGPGTTGTACPVVTVPCDCKVGAAVAATFFVTLLITVLVCILVFYLYLKRHRRDEKGASWYPGDESGLNESDTESKGGIVSPVFVGDVTDSKAAPVSSASKGNTDQTKAADNAGEDGAPTGSKVLRMKEATQSAVTKIKARFEKKPRSDGNTTEDKGQSEKRTNIGDNNNGKKQVDESNLDNDIDSGLYEQPVPMNEPQAKTTASKTRKAERDSLTVSTEKIVKEKEGKAKKSKGQKKATDKSEKKEEPGKDNGVAEDERTYENMEFGDEAVFPEEEQPSYVVPAEPPGGVYDKIEENPHEDDDNEYMEMTAENEEHEYMYADEDFRKSFAADGQQDYDETYIIPASTGSPTDKRPTSSLGSISENKEDDGEQLRNVSVAARIGGFEKKDGKTDGYVNVRSSTLPAQSLSSSRAPQQSTNTTARPKSVDAGAPKLSSTSAKSGQVLVGSGPGNKKIVIVNKE
ncbi:uncharacterized protein DDB_G0286299-like [Ptychodera flava]|uniref:uncharacterized protein DDB_G0286299-like n=1 Tax=Ptychodera flava TaxID=63121 RepID=UPI00396AA36C